MDKPEEGNGWAIKIPGERKNDPFAWGASTYLLLSEMSNFWLPAFIS